MNIETQPVAHTVDATQMLREISHLSFAIQSDNTDFFPLKQPTHFSGLRPTT